MTIRTSQMSEQEFEAFVLAHPVSGGKPGGGGLVNQGASQSAADQQQENSLTGTAQGSLSQFEGPVQNSPFYKALVSQGTEGISAAYNNARSNVADKAKMAGFGYSSPAGQGGNAQLQAQQASSQAELPRNAMTEAAPMALQAAGETAGMGTAYGNQGANYYGSAAGLEGKRIGASQGMYGSLMNIGAQLAKGLGQKYGQQGQGQDSGDDTSA